MTTLEKIWTRPGIYLMPWDGVFDGVCFVTSFLEGVLREPCFGMPTHVDMAVSGPYLSISAAGCRLDADVSPDLLPRLLDPEDPDASAFLTRWWGLAHLQPIVWFSEFCLVDFSTPQAVLRQAYQRGRPLSQALALPLGEQTPYLGLAFTLAPDRVANTRLDGARLREGLALWRKSVTAHAKARGYAPLPRLTYRWRQTASEYYTVRILVSATAA